MLEEVKCVILVNIVDFTLFPYILALNQPQIAPIGIRKQKFKNNGYKEDDKVNVDNSKSVISSLILNAKEKYLQSQGAKLADPTTGPKGYWKILNGFLNKCKIPRIPPLFMDTDFITDCKEKATFF